MFRFDILHVTMTDLSSVRKMVTEGMLELKSIRTRVNYTPRYASRITSSSLYSSFVERRGVAAAKFDLTLSVKEEEKNRRGICA